MTIEWWMIDGLVGAIILIAAISGAARGIGDTVIRLAAFVGGIVLCVMYSGDVSAYLGRTKISTTLHDHIFSILRGQAAEEAAGEASGTSGGIDIGQILGSDAPTGGASDPVTDAMPKSLSGTLSDIADKTADAAATRLTELAMTILAIVLIMLAVWLASLLLRFLIRKLRGSSVVFSFLDRTTGFVLGVLRGLLVACIVMAAIVPVVTWFSPDSVPGLIDAIHGTRLAVIIYDTNPVLVVLRHFLS